MDKGADTLDECVTLGILREEVLGDSVVTGPVAIDCIDNGVCQVWTLEELILGVGSGLCDQCWVSEQGA